MTQNSNSKIHALYIVLILLLLGGLVFTNLKLKKSKETIVVTSTEKDKIQEALNSLDKEYQKALDDLESYREENAGLDSVLTIREKDLLQKKNEIAKLIQSGKANQADLEKARMKNKQLNEERLVFQQKVDSLLVVSQQLSTDKQNLTIEKQDLTVKLETEKVEKKQISEENTKLKSTVDKATILTTSNIRVTPLKSGKKGKEVEVSKAKDAETIKVCFDLGLNRVAPSGETEIAIRLIGPDGSTIQIDALGSGTLRDATTGNDIPYTYKIRPDYQNESKTVCSLWNQDFKFIPGKYSVEVYQKGYLIGQGSFSLK
jgi:hypothetical protein